MLRAACMVIVLAPWVLSPEIRSTSDGAQHAQVVDAVMLEEAVVLRGEEGVFHHVGNLVVGDRNAPLLADLRDQPAAARVNPQGHLHLDVAHRLRRWAATGSRYTITARQAHTPARSVTNITLANASARDPKVLPFHRINSLRLALPAGAMHSSRRFKGKLTERWGRKASGLRDAVPTTAGLPDER